MGSRIRSLLIRENRNWYVRRVDAWKILYEHAVKGGVTIRFGMPVTGLDEQQSAVLFENGSGMKGDLIVGADGTHTSTGRLM